MKIYLAAPYTTPAKLSMQLLDDQMTLQGFKMVSSWYRKAPHPFAIAARDNIEELQQTDVLVLVTTLGGSTGGGMWGELAYALALDKECLVVCHDPDAHIWCHAPGVSVGFNYGWLFDQLQIYDARSIEV